ncbi:MAG: DUF4350 domain-containing protein [Deltaproteobacteria bacterium]|nr:DUF4350 domain-containing protein [Deltaproteobacteria bacterium]
MTRPLMRAGIVGLVLVGLGLGGIVCQRVAARGRYAVPFSTYGAGPQGAKALYLYARGAGLSPTRWARDLIELPPSGMLVAVGGCDQMPSRPVSRYERESLLTWIDGGGVLLVAGAPDYLWDGAGVTLTGAADCTPLGSLAEALAAADRGEEQDPQELVDGFADDPDAVLARLAGEDGKAVAVVTSPRGVLSGVGPIHLDAPGTIHGPSDAEVFLASGKPEVPNGVVVRRGAGAIVVLSSASLFENGALLEADGAVVFARLAEAFAPEGPVIFDEYHLGVGERRSLARYVREIGGAPAALQLLFVVGVLLLGLGVRFGRHESAAPPIPPGTASFIEGVGSLYRRTGDAAAALALVARQGIADVAAHHHAPSVDPVRLSEELDERGHGDAARAVARIAELTHVEKVSARGLVENMQEIDGLVARATTKERRDP